MYEIRVEAEFAAAHFLRDYNGRCENLHGHNYTVYAHVRGETLDSGGMLIDFARLKAALRTVCKRLDHTNLNDIPEFDMNPSAERIARFVYDGIAAELTSFGKDGASSAPNGSSAALYAVDVFETATSRARYVPFP